MILKDSIKSYFNFVQSARNLSAAFEVIFAKKQATNMKQVANGVSYITEDVMIAKYIVDEEFPQ